MLKVTFLLLGVDGQDAEKLSDQVVGQQVHPVKHVAYIDICGHTHRHAGTL